MYSTAAEESPEHRRFALDHLHGVVVSEQLPDLVRRHAASPDSFSTTQIQVLYSANIGPPTRWSEFEVE